MSKKNLEAGHYYAGNKGRTTFTPFKRTPEEHRARVAAKKLLKKRKRK